MNREELLIKDYSYDLPEEKIAKYPLAERDESRLLIYKEGNLEESIYKNLAQFLPPQSFLIFNNTKVIGARLLFTKPSGSTIEIFCLEPGDENKDVTNAMMQQGSVRWKCLVGGAKKWKDELLISKIVTNEKEVILTAKKGQKQTDSFLIHFSWNTDTVSFAEILQLFGNVPVPPYLHRTAEEGDKERYQTIYAKQNGSVAAPTAGLHFTNEVFESLQNKHIEQNFVTLHVGAGTFQPVKTEAVAEHSMHAEWMDVSAAFIENLLAHLSHKIVAVGTTSLRTIESLYWLGVKVMMNESLSPEDLFLQQWEVYEMPRNQTAEEALQALLHWMKRQQLERLICKTQIIIVPGYELKIADGIITNFHQPQSTLLLLIAALVGENWKKIYEYALGNDFRFLSYGDGCLLWKKD